MLWWFRSRASLVSVLVAGLSLLLAGIMGGDPLPLPRIAIGPAPFALLLPAIAAACVMTWLSGGIPALEAISSRRLYALELSLALSILACLFACTLVFGDDRALSLESQGGSPVLLRNTVGYIGVGLIARRWLGASASSGIPVLWAVVAAVIGSPEEPVVWWALAPGHSVVAFLVSTVLFTVGALAGLGKPSLARMAIQGDDA